MRRWLRLDALNRAWRTLLQGIGAVVLFAAGDAAVQVVQRALVDAMAGQPLDWQQVKTRAAYAAATAATMAVLAYWHRRRLDPSRIPSSPPPAPPGTSDAAARSAAQVPTVPGWRP